EGEDIAEDGDDARAEEFVQDLDVVGDAGHEPPDRVFVEEGEAQSLEVAEDLATKVVHHALADPGGEHGLSVLEREGQGERSEVRDGEPCEESAVAVRDCAVDRDLREPWSDELEARRGDEEEDRDG